MARHPHWPPVLVAALLAVGSPVAAQSLTVPAYVIASGGDSSAGGAYALTGTIGQAAAGGQLGGGTFFLAGGFWASLRVGGFTDDPLIAGLSVIRAVHVAELRARIDAVRARYGLAAYVYTNASIAAGTSVLMAADITEMRTALSQAYTNAAMPQPPYTTSPGVGGTIAVADIAELRAAVVAID